MVGSFDGAEHDVLAHRGLARGERRRASCARDQVPPPPGRRPARRGPGGQRGLDARRAARGDRAARTARFVLGVQWHPEADAGSSRGGRAGRRRGRARGPTGTRRVRAGARTRRSARVRTAPYTPRAVRLSRAIRAAAWGMVVAGVAAPLLRKRVTAPPLVVQAVAFGGPLGLCVAVRRSRTRDVAVCALQMWAYLAAYKTPHDDARGAGRARAHSTTRSSPTACSAWASCRRVRLQRALARSGARRPQWRALDRVLVWAHWSWFVVPARRGRSTSWCAIRERFAARGGADLRGVRHRRAASTGCCRPRRRGTPARRAADGAGERRAAPCAGMMVEYGEYFWGDGWGSLYSVFGGNPLAAMPSLHFATSVMAALAARRGGPLAGRSGSAYAATLGFALVYLGEHYVVDLLGGRRADGARCAGCGPARGAGARRARARGRRAGGDGPRGELRWQGG